MDQITAAPALDSVEDRVRLLLDSFMRRAPCSPARSQLDLDCVHLTLVSLATENAEQERSIARALGALRRECRAEGLVFPGAAQ